MGKRFLTMNLLLALALFVFIGCKDSTKSDDDPVNEFKLAADLGDLFLTSGAKYILATNLYNGIQAQTEYYLIDLRSAADYESGHISGAINMTAGNVTDNLSQIPATSTVVCICYTGQTASQVSSYLNIIGYDSYALKWGMCGWTTDVSVNGSRTWRDLTPTDAALVTGDNVITTATEHELPTLDTGEEDAEEIVKDAMDAYFDAGLHHITAASVWPNLSEYFILDLRSESYFTAGHITNGYRVALGELGYAENLKYLPTDSKILVTCYTAHTANHAVAYLNMLGYDAWNLKFGINSVTSNTDICMSNYSVPATNYSVVTGPNPTAK